MRKLIYLSFMVLIVAMSSMQSNLAYSSQGRGGDDPAKIDEATLTLLIKGDGLKNAMLNYLKTIDVSQIQDADIKSAFSQMLKDGALQRDIQTKNNYTLGDSCLDAYNSEVPVSTELGQLDKPNIGGEICFDLKKLVVAYQNKNLTEEQLMIKLASLAFHEHVHHFQVYSKSDVQSNEESANKIAAYIQITARFVQVPLLKWSPTADPSCTKLPADFKNFTSDYTDDSLQMAAGLDVTTQKYLEMESWARRYASRNGQNIFISYLAVLDVKNLRSTIQTETTSLSIVYSKQKTQGDALLARSACFKVSKGSCSDVKAKYETLVKSSVDLTQRMTNYLARDQMDSWNKIADWAQNLFDQKLTFSGNTARAMQANQEVVKNAKDLYLQQSDLNDRHLESLSQNLGECL